MKMGNISVSTS